MWEDDTAGLEWCVGGREGGKEGGREAVLHPGGPKWQRERQQLMWTTVPRIPEWRQDMFESDVMFHNRESEIRTKKSALLESFFYPYRWFLYIIFILGSWKSRKEVTKKISFKSFEGSQVFNRQWVICKNKFPKSHPLVILRKSEQIDLSGELCSGVSHLRPTSEYLRVLCFPLKTLESVIAGQRRPRAERWKLADVDGPRITKIRTHICN